MPNLTIKILLLLVICNYRIENMKFVITYMHHLGDLSVRSMSVGKLGPMRNQWKTIDTAFEVKIL